MGSNVSCWYELGEGLGRMEKVREPLNREAAASENGNAEDEKGKCQLHATFVGDGFLLNSNCSFCIWYEYDPFSPCSFVLISAYSAVFFSHNKSTSAKISQPETIQRACR
jgi:hypothetical protein